MRKAVIAVACGAALLCAAALPMTAISQEAMPAGLKKVLIIPPCSFTAWEDGYDFQRHTDLKILTGGSATFVAPLNIPKGSRILKIMLVCMDVNGSAHASLSLYRSWHTEGGTGTAVIVVSTGSSSNNTYWTYPAFVPDGMKYVGNKAHFLSLYIGGPNIYVKYAKVVYKLPS